ncbi:MAG: glycosyltransferase family 4 protein [Candidatus Obscuribacterales bacterium]|nr:glycosyltransferase family 4 protein [Candidatus Obscuribacterales bacterium]
MKIVVISHTYIVDLNRRKLRQLCSLQPDIDLTVIVPQVWEPQGVQSGQVRSEPLTEGRFRVLPMSNFSRNNQGLLVFGHDLLEFLQEFQPDIVQVEQGAKSLAHAELIMARQVFKLHFKLVMFTWWNLPYELQFPLNKLEQYNLANTQGLIAGNQDALNILKEHGFKGQTTVLPQLGVDEELFSSNDSSRRAKRGIDTNDFIIGFAGRLVEEKGIRILLEAFDLLVKAQPDRARKIRLWFIGQGPLETLVRSHSTPGIHLQPAVAHDEMPEYLNALDALVLPSLTSDKKAGITLKGWKEQFGHILIEAMSCSVPVIGSDSGEIPHVIGRAGLICPEGNARALADAVESLVENEEKRRLTGQRGRERVMSHYTDTILARKQFEFYQSLLSV